MINELLTLATRKRLVILTVREHYEDTTPSLTYLLFFRFVCYMLNSSHTVEPLVGSRDSKLPSSTEIHTLASNKNIS